MLSFGIASHKYLIYAYLAVLFFHLFKLIKAEDPSSYRRFMIIYNPMLTLPTLGGVLFSGLVLLTATGFAFNTANIIMIAMALGMVMHEFKRSKELKYTPNSEFASYKKRALRYILTNIALIFLTTFLAIYFRS